jgi:hypothetical protein
MYIKASIKGIQPIIDTCTCSSGMGGGVKAV